jgi:phenylalanyl-tRNA synthetase alpha chain
MATSLLDPSDYARALALRDLTEPTLGPHAMQLLVQQAVEALRAAWHCPVVVYRAPAVVSVRENYDDLRYPTEGASREARYTRYVTSDLLMRTQTSAMIPGALRMIAAAHYDDVLVVCPGLTYRRDSIDRLHVGEPHQLDLWRIARRPLGRSDMEAMIDLVASAMLPGARLRLDAAAHPYTIDGIEVHAEVDGPNANRQWVEILECGLAHPQILEQYAGLPPSLGSGLAMGIGLDRMLMLRKGIDDIRALRSSDPRIVAQMQDLQPYRVVSSLPPIQRDLSIAVDATATAEELGDQVRTAVGERSRAIESVEVLAETSYLELSVAARRRLGIAPDQKNVLLRLVIRDLERTLTSAEANVLRDEIYAALHCGSVKTWASKEMQL